MESVFDDRTVESLNKPLDPRFVSSRTGAGNKSLSYMEGHDVIDQGNRIFGYGNWAPETLSCEQVVLLDPLTGEAVGIKYSARVRIHIRDAEPITEVGSQPVSSWNVYDQVMSRRESQARYKKTEPDYEAEITREERKNACAVIAEAHEQAEKGAVTDAMKRGMRVYGDQFGNGLYGDGRIFVYDEPAQDASAPVSAMQKQAIRNLCWQLKRKVAMPSNFGTALQLIDELQMAAAS